MDLVIKKQVAKKSSKNSPWGPPGPHSGGVWGRLGRLRDALGRLLCAFWAPFGRSWASHWSLSSLFGVSWALKARFGLDFGGVWEGFGG